MKTIGFTLAVLAATGNVALAQSPDPPRLALDILALGSSAAAFGAFVAAFVAFIRTRSSWLHGERITLFAGLASFLGAFGLFEAGALTDPQFTGYPSPWTWIGFGALAWLVASGGYDLVVSFLRARAPVIVGVDPQPLVTPDGGPVDRGGTR